MSGTTSGGVSVQDLHDLVDTLEDLTTQDVLAKTADYTAAVADNRRKISFNSATPVSLTVPSNVPAGWEITVAQLGAGAVTVAVNNGTVRSKGDIFTTAGQYSAVSLFCVSNTGNFPILILTGDTAPAQAPTRWFSNGMSSGFR
jgi:hypothetical protein